jgi:hypothetical protein
LENPQPPQPNNPNWAEFNRFKEDLANVWGPGASQWSMDDRSSVMSDWQRLLDWLLA